jgi:hypothetical protein
MSWVKIEKYCSDTGDTKDAVQKKLRRGIWLRDTHVKTAPDGRLWVNIKAVNEWVENGLKGTVPTRRSA